MFSRMRGPDSAVGRDALVVALATAAMAALCVQFDFSEALRRWTAPWERFQLDELPAVLVVLAAGMAWFAARRYGEAGRYLNVIKLDAVAVRDGRLTGATSLRERAEAIVANCNHIHTALTSLI